MVANQNRGQVLPECKTAAMQDSHLPQRLGKCPEVVDSDTQFWAARGYAARKMSTRLYRRSAGRVSTSAACSRR